MGTERPFDGADFDSRTVRRGEMFVAVKGDDRDGHEYVGAALDSGSSVALVNSSASVDLARLHPNRTFIAVPDTVTALAAIARAVRAGFSGSVVGVTGSVGKTTTKEMIRLALGTFMPTHASEASFNNDLGVPVSILRAPSEARAWVLEMGMRGFGEISRLCDIAAPTVGVVTAVASAHSDRVGGIEGVARAKAELVQALSEDGLAVLNADNEYVAAMAGKTKGRVITFGCTAGADVLLDKITTNSQGCVSAVLETPWGSADLALSVPGVHLAVDAAAAVAVAGALGGDIGRAAASVGTFAAASGRMQVHHLASGTTLIDDSYNANPASMEAALRTLADLALPRKIAILGTMAEISDSELEHNRIVELARSLGIEVFSLEEAPYPCRAVSVEAVVEIVRGACPAAVLVKGSRAARTERVVAALREL